MHELVSIKITAIISLQILAKFHFLAFLKTRVNWPADVLCWNCSSWEICLKAGLYFVHGFVSKTVIHTFDDIHQTLAHYCCLSPPSGLAPHKTREANGSRKVYGFQTKGDLACKKSFKDQIKFCFVHKIQNPFS